MANRKLRLITKQTAVPGRIPSGTTGSEENLVKQGELAMNTVDKALYSYDGTNVFEVGDGRFFRTTGGTISGDVNVTGESSFAGLSATTFYSGSTDLEEIIKNIADEREDITRVQGGTNIVTGGTANEPTINVVDSPSFNNLNSSGDTILSSTTATTISVENYIDFSTEYTGNTIVEGRMNWDEKNGTISLGMHGANVSQQIGLEQFYYIKNQSGSTIENGRVVRAAGTLGASGRILGEYMIADGTIPPKFTLGVSTEDISSGDDGYVTNFGLVRGIDTTGSLYGETWSDGDILWASPTISGGLTNVNPISPNLHIEIAIVINSSVNGSIFVRPHLYPYAHDIQDMGWSAGTESNLDVIQWDSDLGYFKLTNAPIFSSISGSSISATTLYSGNTDLSDLFLPIDGDVFVTGGTFISSSDTLVLTNNEGGSFSVTGVTVGTSGFLRYEDDLATADSSLTTISTITGVTTDTARFVKNYLTAHKDGSDYGFWERTLAVNNVTGNVSIEFESADLDAYSSGLTSASVVYSASGSDILVQVKGEVAKSYDWTSTWEVIDEGFAVGSSSLNTINPRVIDPALTTINITSSDAVVGIDTSSSSIDVNLPDSVSTGYILYTLKDIGFSASTNNININTSGSDDIYHTSVVSSLTINENGGSFMLSNNGNGSWYVV